MKGAIAPRKLGHAEKLTLSVDKARGVVRETFWISLHDGGSRTFPADYNNGLTHARSHHQKTKKGVDGHAIQSAIRGAILDEEEELERF